MEIKVGDYIRTKDGCIGKVSKIIETDIEETYYCCDTSTTGGYEANIKKHSPNISDLVEVNDIVNGYRIIGIYERSAENEERILDIGYGMTIFNEEVKTILTHELYEENCYKVGGEDE